MLHALLLVCLSVLVSGQDAQWRGPTAQRDFSGDKFIEAWPEDGPEILFVAEDLGKSYSSAVATRNVIYTTGIKDSLEYLTALDMEGNLLWQNPFGPGWKQSFPESQMYTHR